MDSNEKQEIKELIRDLIAGYTAQTESKFSIIDFKLDAIKEQTANTTNKVNINETKIVELEKHPLNCPLQSKIRTIEDTLLEHKSIKNYIAKSVGITAAVLTIITAIMKFTGIL